MLKRSPEVSKTQGLVDQSIAIRLRLGVEVDVVRAVDHEIATGIYPDMTEHGWEHDERPAIFEHVVAGDILVLFSRSGSGEVVGVHKVIERLYDDSHLLNDPGQWVSYGRVGGCIITDNEDGAKQCAMNILYPWRAPGTAPTGSGPRRRGTGRRVSPRVVAALERLEPLVQFRAPLRTKRPEYARALGPTKGLVRRTRTELRDTG